MAVDGACELCLPKSQRRFSPAAENAGVVAQRRGPAHPLGHYKGSTGLCSGTIKAMLEFQPHKVVLEPHLHILLFFFISS